LLCCFRPTASSRTAPVLPHQFQCNARDQWSHPCSPSCIICPC
jgi:hypothetical protein